MLFSLKIQLALTLILKTMAEYPDILRTKECPNNLVEPCKCLYSPDRKEIIVKCMYPIIKYHLSPPSQVSSATPIKSLNKRAICVLFIENGHFYKFDRSVGDYIKAPIVVMRNAAVKDNIDMFEAFRGMDDYLYALVLRNVAMNNATLNEIVKGFRQFRIFHLEDCWTPYLYTPLNASSFITRLPKTVCEITVKSCHIDALQNNAFERYKGLRKLDLSHNYLTSVSRSNLPRPANYLLSYDISNNRLFSLPDDMFVEMPALRIIKLKSTKISTLPYSTFEPVLNHLDWLEISSIPLTCDCEASWLTVNLKLWKKTETDRFPCVRPDAVRHRFLDSLEPLDLCISCEKVILEKTTFTSNLNVTNSTTETNYSRNADIGKENSTAINSERIEGEYKGDPPSRKSTDVLCLNDRICVQACELYQMYRGSCVSNYCVCETEP